MRTANVVNRKLLTELYGGELVGYGDLNSPTSFRVLDNITSEELEIKIIQTIGPYCLVETPQVSHPRNKIIVEKSHIICKEVPEAIELYGPILDIYHKDHWRYVGEYLLIHYPVIEIKNSLGHSHTIEDLIVRINLFKNGLVNNITAKRTSWTLRELQWQYSHSHLPNDIFSWQTFCLGSGSSFDRFIKGMKKVNSVEEFELMLIQLGEYLGWESLEGTPYRSISTLSGKPPGGNVSGGGSMMPEDLVDTVAKELLKQLSTEYLSNQGDGAVLSPAHLSSGIQLNLIRLEYEVVKALNIPNMYTAGWRDSESSYFLDSTNIDVQSTLGAVIIPSSMSWLTPRIIPSDETSESETDRRFLSVPIEQIIKRVNWYLLQATQKLKDK